MTYKPGQGNRPEVVIQHNFEDILPGIKKCQGPEPAWRASDVLWRVCTPGYHRRNAIERGMLKSMLLLGSDASTRPREDHLSQGPISIHNSFSISSQICTVIWISREILLCRFNSSLNHRKQSKAKQSKQCSADADESFHGCRHGRSRKASWSNCV